MKRFSALVSSMAVAFVLTIIFQNCAGYQSGVNPLTDTPEASECVGVSCKVDLDFVEIQVANAQPVGIVKPKGNAQVFCDPTTCVDIAGYCNTAGYPDSKFYYQWKVNNGLIGSKISTSVKCDAMGRFRILVNLPSPSVHTFVYENIYAVEISMSVMDEYGEYENPSTGVGSKSVSITGI